MLISIKSHWAWKIKDKRKYSIFLYFQIAIKHCNFKPFYSIPSQKLDEYTEKFNTKKLLNNQNRFRKIIEDSLRGYCTPNQKLAFFVLCLKIINTFLKK